MNPMLAKERMKEAVKDHSILPEFCKPFNSINFENHKRGIDLHSPMQTLSDYNRKCVQNK